MRWIALALLVACSKPDDCERLIKKVASAMPGELRGQSEDSLVAECRQHLDKVKQDPSAKCVLDADGDDAVRTCITARVEQERRHAADARAKAEADAAKAAADAKATADSVTKLQGDLDKLARSVDQAIDDVNAAKSKADVDAVKAKLSQLQAERAELERQIAAAKAAAARAERAKGVHISPECLENPLAKGCS
jgi:colicin import membrane protein